MLEIVVIVKGKLDSTWSSWFEGLSVEGLPDGNTVLHGFIPDQPAVYGILSRLSSVGIPLISCECHDTK